MKGHLGIHVGTVVGNTSPQEFRFYLRSFAAKLGDLVSVHMEVPTGQGEQRDEVLVWGRIVELARFNPFLPAEAGQELADEGVQLVDTVLSQSRDQIEGKVLVLGCTGINDLKALRPLNYPVSPGAEVRLPPPESVRTILTGDEETPRIHLGHLIGRSDVEVRIKTNAIVARHMAVLAMTGGGKTVAARRIIRELLRARYPLVILDPHGDYLGFWVKKDLFPTNSIRLFYPHLRVKEENRDLIAYLVAQMTQGFTDPQREIYHDALEAVSLDDAGISVSRFIERLLEKLQNMTGRHAGTIPAVKRGLRIVRGLLDAMEASNERLRRHSKLKELPFEPMPDPVTEPHGFVQPGQASIVYLGGYDHLTQSTIVAVILKHLFEERASMRNTIPPFLAVIEEAHNFVPSHTEGQADTPSLDIVRKVITEGRKFGTGLLLISQRPSRLDETTLSQCNTFLIFRLVNPRDQGFVEKIMENLTKADLRLLPGFGPGQGIVSGQAVRFPLVIQVDYDSDLITPTLGDEDFLRAVAEWERSPNAAAVRRAVEFERELEKI
jgi:DNA helicase HerA-like ATPase